MNIDARSDVQWTALMAASFMRRREVVKILLERGADKKPRDNLGRTARALALENHEIVALIDSSNT